jgi:hypothetical protein
MRRLATLLLAISLIGCKGNSPSNGQAVVHAADQSPSWYITDLGTKVIDDDKFDRITRGELTVDGMWYATSSIKDKQLVDPIAVKIDCDREVHICREFDATVSMGMLKPDSDDFRISTWDAKHLLAVDENEGKCNITHRLVMDFDSRTVTLTDLPSQVDTAECRMYRDANSYVLHDGGVMLYPPAHYDPLAKKSK